MKAIILALLVSTAFLLQTTTGAACDKLPSSDICQFVQQNCGGADIVVGRVDYLSMVYCQLGSSISHPEPLGCLILLLLLLAAFVVLGTAASEYFCPNISTLSRLLHLSPDIAGITLVALGNASNDLIGNLISFQGAKNTDTSALAIGELLGSGLFLSCIVVGTIGLLGDGTVTLNSRAVVRDVGFYLVGLVLAGSFIGSGYLRWWHGLVLLLVYFVYVFVVILETMRFKKPILSPTIAPEITTNEVEPDIPVIDNSPEEQYMMVVPTITIDAASIHETGTPPSKETVKDSDLMATPTRHRRTKSESTKNLLEADNKRLSSYSTGSSTHTPRIPSRLFREYHQPVAVNSPPLLPLHLPPANRRISAPVFGTSKLSSPPAIENESSAEQVSRNRVSENIVSLRLNESIMENMRLNSLSGALELWSAWRQLKLDSPTEEVTDPMQIPVPSSSSDFLFPATFSFLSLNRISSRTSQNSAVSVAASTLSRQQQSQTILSNLLNTTSDIDKNDRCTVCYRGADEALLSRDGTTQSRLFDKIMTSIWVRHFFPLYTIWGILGVLGRVLGLINLLPNIAFSATIPVVASFDGAEDSTATSITTSPSITSPHESIFSVPEPKTRTRSKSRRKSPRRIQNQGLNASTDCPYGKCTFITWSHRWINVLNIGLFPFFFTYAVNSLSAEVGALPAWIVSIIIGMLAALIFAVVSQSGKRLLRTSYMSGPEKLTCEHTSCDFCYTRSRMSLKERLKRLLTRRYWKFTPTHRLLAVVGFVNGLLWIYVISSEVISILKASGKILHISDSILGMTVFAFGNVVGDFATNFMIARMGYFSMAIGATWGAPMFNLLMTLGIAIPALWPRVSGSTTVLDVPKVSVIVTVTFVALVSVLVMNILILGVWQKFRLSRAYSIFLIAFWIAIMTVNIIIEATQTN